MKSLFIKAFVEPFYKAFFGFFVLIFIVGGLLMEVRQHVMIGERILQSTIAFSILLLLFLLYGWLQFRFQLRLLESLRYRVFHQMALLKSSDFSSLQFAVWVYNHLLLLTYGLFISFLALKSGYWVQPIILWMLLPGMFFAHKYQLFYALSRPLPEEKPSILKKLTKRNYPIARAYWLVIHLKENRLLLMLACKGIALILLKLFFYSFSEGTYDERWLQFGVLCSAFINFPIWVEKKEFEENKLTALLNLPQLILKKSWLHFYSTLQIISPEIVYLVFHYSSFQHLGQALTLLVLMVTLNLGIYALINFTKNVSDLPRNAFLVFVSIFFLIIFGIPAVLISALAVVLFVISIRSPYRI